MKVLKMFKAQMYGDLSALMLSEVHSLCKIEEASGRLALSNNLSRIILSLSWFFTIRWFLQFQTRIFTKISATATGIVQK